MKILEVSENEKCLKLVDNKLLNLHYNFFQSYHPKMENIEMILNRVVLFVENQFSFFNNIVKLSITAESLQEIYRESFQNMKKLKYLYLNIPKVNYLPYFHDNCKLKEIKLYIPSVLYFNYMFSFNFYIRFLKLITERNPTLNKVFKNNTLPFLEVLIIVNVNNLKIDLGKKFFYSLYNVSTLKLVNFNLKDKIFLCKISKLMPRLRKLFLNACLIKNLDFLKKLKNLIELDLSSNLISWTENAFKDNFKLEYLNLSKNPFFISRHTLNNLSNLFYLNWSDCRLQKLESNSFQKCSGSLQTINLSNNLLRNLDDKLFENCYNLKNLILANNLILVINQGIFDNLINLVYLSLERNIFIHLDVNIFSKLVNLENLNLSDNILPALNSDWFRHMEKYNLKYLALNNNIIKQLLMNNFTLLSCLVNLNLKNNNLLNIDNNVFMYCKNLKFLDLSTNLIRMINTNSFKGLVNLKELLLKENNILVIEKNSFNTLIRLEVLNLEFNLIESLEPDLFQYNNNLKCIDLSSNFITQLPENLLFYTHNIQWLDISNNQIDEQNGVGLLQPSSSMFHLFLERD